MSWPQPTISGYNATPPADDGSQTASNVVAWATILAKIGNPLKTLLEATIASLPPYLVPTGAIQAFAGSAAPSGWLLCFGQAVSRSTYADLFAVIGTTYGAGDGATTFNVPDLRDRIALGKGDMGGTDAARISLIDTTTLGGTSGAETLPLHEHAGPAHAHDMGDHVHIGGVHTHIINDPGHSHTYGTNNGSPGSQPFNAVASGSGVTNSTPSTSSSMAGISIQGAGAVATSGPSTNITGLSGAGNTSSAGAGNHGVLQPSLVLNYLIKA